MADEKGDVLPMQEAVLALLCFDKQAGTKLAVQVVPDNFDGPYQDFASRVLQYRRRYREPPGRAHTRDLADRSFHGKDNLLIKKRLLPQLLASGGDVNIDYVLSRTQAWVKKQVYRAAVYDITDEAWDGDDDEALTTKIATHMSKALRWEQRTLQPGTRLSDPALLQFVSHDDEFISLGIPELDRMGIGMTRREMLLYIAPKGTGKTWFCCHCGRQALMQRLKVLHVSLEMSEQKIGRRYLQTLFAVARKKDRFTRVRLLFDDNDDLVGFKSLKRTPKLAFTMPRIRRILRRKQRAFGTRLGNLVIRDFPSGMLTVEQLEGYLDYLAEVENFIPDLLIVDYPDLMSVHAKTLRIDIGQNFVALRGILQKRNMIGVMPTQSGRETIRAKRVRSKNVTEDISKIQTADTTLAYMRTEDEESLNLGRLSVEHSRDTEGNRMILLAQSYDTGQYVLDSAVVTQSYSEQLRELFGDTQGGDKPIS